jgi:limonene-1,2-epoxide hydrolase
MNYRIESAEQIIKLWTDIYNTQGKPDWSGIIPFYDEMIYFRDSVQEIHGKKKFIEMTERLAKRSQNLKMKIINISIRGVIIFIEWEMTLSFNKLPNSKMYGVSRLTLSEEGKIIKQRDYYDLWGDIMDNIPGIGKGYRKFMQKIFG